MVDEPSECGIPCFNVFCSSSLFSKSADLILFLLSYSVIYNLALFRKSVDFANCDVYHVLVQLLII